MKKRLDYVVVGKIEQLSVYIDNELKLVFQKLGDEYRVTDGVNEITDHDYNIDEIFTEYGWLRHNLP